MKKRVITGAALLLVLCTVLAACAFPGNASPVLYANAFGGGKGDGGTVRSCRGDDGTLLLLLPSGAAFSSLKLWCRAPGKARIDGEPVRNGERCPAVTADGAYTLSCGADDYPLLVVSSREVPAVFIETASGSLEAIHADKAHREAAKITVYEDGKQTLSAALESIKGRGNQTWSGEKRPYNIRFPEKTPLLGMDAARSWCLLANASDDTLIRNSTALTLAQRMEIPYACDFRPADVYLNGDYRGSYLVTEKVAVNDAVVDIDDLDDRNAAANPGVQIDALPKLTSGGHADCGNLRWTDLPASPAEISGGYLIEFDGETYYEEETNGFCTARGQFVTVKSPSCASKAEIDYISGFCNEAEEALTAADGYNSLGRHYSEYYDVPSLAKMFVLNEFLLNADAGFSSTFFSKETGGKLVAGPAWDYDTCLHDDRTVGVTYVFKADHWCTNLLCMNRYNMDATVFEKAFRHTDFREAAALQWEKYRPLFSAEAMESLVRSLAEALRGSAAADHFRWAPRTLVSAREWEDFYVDGCLALSRLAADRFPAMEKGLSGSAAMLYYDLNGASGWMFSEKIVLQGESVAVKDCGEDAFLEIVPPQDAVFAGWNTAADGSGENLAPGEEIVLTAPSTVLYARWDREE